MDPASLAIGGASLAIQIFQGCVTGFEYFEAAVDADKDCNAFKLRLQIEFARLYDWGDLVGLLDEATHTVYDGKTRQNRTIIIAILNELQYLLRNLRQLYLRYEDLSTVGDEDEDVPAPLLQMTDSGHLRARPDSLGIAGDRRLVESDLEQYQSLFPIQSEGGIRRKHRKGLNHIIGWYHGAGTVVKHPKRLQWAVRDKSKCVEKLRQVTDLVDYLHQTVSENQMAVLVETSRETKLGMLALTRDIAGMKALLEAIQENLPSSVGSSSSLDGRTLVDDHSSGQARPTASVPDLELTSEKRFTKLLEQVINFKILRSKSEGDNPDTQISEDIQKNLSILGDLDYGLRTQARVNTTTATLNPHLWIEWKSYHPIPSIDGSAELVPDSRSLSAVKELTALLQLKDRPTEFCVPNCLGHLVDTANRRFGLLFEPPQAATGPPQSLVSLLNGHAVGLRKRIQIAMQLSQCLLLFHAVDWLHKGIRSANVLFFPTTAADTSRRLLGPAYITGFEYTRRADPANTNTGPHGLEWAFYVHPDYLGYKHKYGFKRSYDIYSLGIIMIELALWKSIDSILGFEGGEEAQSEDDQGLVDAGAELDDDEDVNPSVNKEAESSWESDEEVDSAPSKDSMPDIRRIRENLLAPPQSVLEQVEDVMGLKYRKAVTACIEGMPAFGLDEDQNQEDPVVATLLQQEFIRVVVDMLESIDV